jgi:transposase InsO family protein
MSYVPLSGYEYQVIFIDDFSRKSWIFFMKTKGHIFKQFQEFKALVEKQTRKKIKVLRSNNGSEYASNEFNEFCAREGIKRELIVLYNPQQNGVVERKNMDIVGVVRAMLHDQGLPLFIWVEGCNKTVYLQNMSPHRVLGDKTHEKDFYGKKHEFGKFRIFGFLTYSHVPSEKRIKLEPRTKMGIFVGYSDNSKDFCIYIPLFEEDSCVKGCDI